MKLKLLILITLFAYTFESFSQINPVTNLTWTHWYDNGNNYFILEWDEPDSPHNEIIGYNVYRENDFFIFINETSIYNVENLVIPEEGSNCGGEEFLFYNNGEGFNAHVTAVYEPGDVESDYTETVYIDGPMLEIIDFDHQKIKIYPNPTNGVIHIENTNLVNIKVYTISGKLIREIEPQPQIDLSDITKGVYLIQLITDTKPVVYKIIIE